MENMVLEFDIIDAWIVITGLDWSYRHTDTVPHVAVSDCDVLRAWGLLECVHGCLHGNGIVKISDIEALNEDVLTTYVDSVGVEWEPWQSVIVKTRQKVWGEVIAEDQTSNLHLALEIHLDLEVVEVAVRDIFDVQVLFWWIHPFDTSELKAFRLSDVSHSRTAFRVEIKQISDPPHIALTIDGTISTESHILDVMESQEVSDVVRMVNGPVSEVLM